MLIDTGSVLRRQNPTTADGASWHPNAGSPDGVRPSARNPVKVSLRDDPEYCAADDAHARMIAEVAKLEARRVQLIESTSAALAARKQAVDRAAEALLDGKASEAPSLEALAVELQGVLERLHVARRAEEIARGRADRARMVASDRICQKLMPKYKDIARRMASALKALAAVAEEEADLRAGLVEGDVLFLHRLPPLPFPQADMRPDKDRIFPYGNSAAGRWFTAAHEAGVL
jgi:hypothetical protein